MRPSEEHSFPCRGLDDLIAREDDLPELWRPDNKAVATYKLFEQGSDYDLLLYVGITKSPPRRFRQHRAEKPWVSRVDLVLVDWWSSRKQASRAEVKAIELEHPAFNVWPAANAFELGAFEAHDAALHRIDWYSDAHHTVLRRNLRLGDCAPTALEEILEV